MNSHVERSIEDARKNLKHLDKVIADAEKQIAAAQAEKPHWERIASMAVSETPVLSLGRKVGNG